MRAEILLAFLLTIFQCATFAQTQPQPQAQQKTPQRIAPAQSNQLDQLGMTCIQILQLSSTDWIAHFNEAASEKPALPPTKSAAGNVTASAPDKKTLRAIAAYGKCYDARTDRLAAALAKSGKGPLMGARGNFRDFDQALQNFTKKALAESQPPADALKSAYAALYEKQFRYAFYQSYDQPTVKPAPAAASATPPSPKTAPPPSLSADAPTTTAPPAKKDVDPVTLAKNHFGELLADLPDDNMHDLHAAFGQILVLNSVGASMQLAIYRYAIFLLEPPATQPPAPSAHAANSNQPFAPPPF